MKDEVSDRYALLNLKMSESAVHLALAGTCLLAVITLAMTFLLTLDAVLASVNRNERTAPLHAPSAEETAPLFVDSTKMRLDRSYASNTLAKGAGRVKTAPRGVTGVVAPITSYVSQPPVERSIAAEPLSTDSFSASVDRATVGSLSVPQDPATTLDEQVVVASATFAPSKQHQQQCGEGLTGALCREVVRWTSCHPDKWDTTQECFVEKFDSEMQ